MQNLSNKELNEVKIGTKVRIIGGLGTYKVRATIYSSSKGNEASISNGCGTFLIEKFENLMEIE